MFSITFSFLILFISILFYYLKSKYFTLRGSIPGVAPHFFFGNLIQCGFIGWKQKPIDEVFSEWREKFGDVYQFWSGAVHLIVINRLEDIQHIFSHRQIYDQGELFTQKFKLLNPNGIICLTGPKFKRHAAVTGPLFRRGRILVHLETIIDCTDRLIDRWQNFYKDPKQIHLNMIEQSQQLLMAIFGYIAFDYDLQTLDDNAAFENNELTQAFYDLLNTLQLILQLPVALSRIFIFCNWKARRARKIIDRYLEQMIEHELRMSTEIRAGRKKVSLIASLVSSLQHDEQAEANKPEEEKKGLSKIEVMNEMLAFLAAGYGTTSTAVSWFIHLVSKHPRVQQKLKEELLPFEGRPLSLEQLESLTYLECVLKEIFRVAAPVSGTVRTLITDDKLPYSEVQLEKGSSVFIPFYGLARDPRYWSDRYKLNEFHPERFIEDTENKNNMAALITFGGGHRGCMGEDLARFELKIICTRLMQRVTFGDGGPILNAGGFEYSDTIKPKKVGVTVSFDSNNSF